MSILTVFPITEAFGALWPELAKELGLELRVVGSTAEMVRGDVPPLLVIAGAEAEAQAEIRALSAAGHSPIVIGSDADHRLALTLIRAGAGDYFALPGDLQAMRAAIESAARLVQQRSRNGGAPGAGPSEARYDFSQIVGGSSALRATLDRAARVIPHGSASVLLTGETGTGKELLARAIHYNGPRASGAFVEINCAAIPPSLLESELFGYERGAFTDARNPKPGLFEAADRGTLFLDEIGHMPLAVQGKLLKALEEKRIRRLGSVRQIEVDVRIMAATHVHLETAVAAGEFREDLYYRLAVIPLHLPPLRERGADALLLAEHFIVRLAEQYGLEAPPLTEPVRAILASHGWPGNVRELRNALERALLLGSGSLDPAELFMPGPSRRRQEGKGPIPFPASLAEIEKNAAHAMVELHQGNKSAAAADLEISRSRLYRLLDEAPDEASED